MPAALLMLLAVMLGVAPAPATAQLGITPGRTYWYKPDHDQFGRTSFYSANSFDSPQVAVPNRTQTMLVLNASRGWVQVEFSNGQKGFIHVRVLQSILHVPGATDPHYEFKRASLFHEDPAKIEAALRDRSTPAGTPGKTPAWRRYKDNWTGTAGRKPAPESAGESGNVPEKPEKSSIPGVDRRNRPTLTSPGANPSPPEAAPPAQ